MLEIMSGEATPAQIASYITALRIRGETAGRHRRQRRRPCARNSPPSTRRRTSSWTPAAPAATAPTRSTSPPASAFVAAGAGVTVAKHGNRSVSSKCGSADVLAALGVKIDATAGHHGASA